MPPLLFNINWSFFDERYLGEKTSNYLLFAAIVLGTLLLKKPLTTLLTRVSSRFAARYNYTQHKDTVRGMLFQPIERLLQIVLYYVAVSELDHILSKVAVHYSVGQSEKINLNLGVIVDHIFLFLFIVFLTQVIIRFVDFIYYLRMTRAYAEHNQSRIQLLPLIKEMAKLLLLTASGFWILGTVFHVNVPALITGLGIGGVAIALAGKETVENFFAAFTILSDKPFKTGETIKLGDIEGIVERIGFRSTRIRNADGSATIIPNQNLVSQNLINLSMRDTRMMKVIANVKYGISHQDLQTLIAALKDALLNINTVKEPIEIAIESFDKETFQLIISYYLPYPLPDNVQLPAIKREVNMKAFEIITKYAELGVGPSTKPAA